MKIRKDFVHREIAGDHILVPVGKTVSEYPGLFPITESGGVIWEMLPDVESEEEIVEKLLEEYEADRKTVENDVKEFLAKLREFEII